MRRINKIMDEMRVIRNGVVRNIKIHEKQRKRVTWKEMMRGAPECCLNARSMVNTGTFHRCNICGRLYESDGDRMICVS